MLLSFHSLSVPQSPRCIAGAALFRFALAFPHIELWYLD